MDLRQDLQALIGPEEEWPDEVKEYMHARYVMLSQRREARDAIDVTFNARIEAAIAVPDAALLAVARMVKRGTCGECRFAENEATAGDDDLHEPGTVMYSCLNGVCWYRDDPYQNPADFGCSLWEARTP